MNAALEKTLEGRLPVVGENHPLRRIARRITIGAMVWAGVIHLLAFGGWLAYREFSKKEVSTRDIKIARVVSELPAPPSIAQESAPPPVAAVAPVAPPAVGVPEPVPDFEAEEPTLATQTEMSEMLVPSDLSDIGSGFDSLVVEEGGDPGPEDFVAVEQMPVLVTLPAPYYPELARQAGIDGLVMVRALVNEEGKIDDAIAVDGPDMLIEPAIVAVKKAVFRPALQQHRPVAVWINVPIRFSLN
jgi:protein TonB